VRGGGGGWVWVVCVWVGGGGECGCGVLWGLGGLVCVWGGVGWKGGEERSETRARAGSQSIAEKTATLGVIELGERITCDRGTKWFECKLTERGVLKGATPH